MSGVWPAHIALIFVQLFFGFLPVVGKVVLRELEPLALVCLRIAGAALLLSLLRAASRLAPVRGWRDHGRMALYGLLGVGLNQVLFLEGLARTTAINASVLTTAIPVFSTMLAILFGQERATVAKTFGIGLSLAGALSLVGVEGLELGNRYLLGNLMVIANCFSYSVYLVISKPLLEKYPPLSVVTWVFIYGLLWVLPVGWPALGRLELATVGSGTWAGLAAIILFPTVGSYLLNLWALRRVEVSLVAVYIYLQPLVTTSLGVLWLEERVSGGTAMAALLIFSGVFVVSQARRREAAARREG